MRISTLLKSGLLRSVAVTAVLGMGYAVQAQTFVHEGLIYKVSKGAVAVQKPGTKLTSGTAPTDYTGAISVPKTVSYNGKNYNVASIAGSAFANTSITSITIADGNAIDIGRGAFMNCQQLETVVLNNDLPSMKGNLFQGCSKLRTITIPGSVATVPNLTFGDNIIKVDGEDVTLKCEALEEIIFAESDQPLTFNREAFGTVVNLKHVVINRPMAEISATDSKAFRGVKTLESVEIGAKCDGLYSAMFENCVNLSSLVLGPNVASFGYNALANTALTDVVIPANVTALASGLMMGCTKLTSVTLPEGLKTIDAMAFANSALSEINFPSTLTSIGNLAFSGTQLSGELVLPEGLKSVGEQTFANIAGLTSVKIPASVTSIQGGAFMRCTNIAKFDVAAENEVYTTTPDGSALITKDGKTLVAYAAASPNTTLEGDYESVGNYALYGATNLTKVSLPNCKNWGAYALSRSGITELTVAGAVDRYVADSCPALKKLTVLCDNVPVGVAANCPELTEVVLNPQTLIVRQDAFLNCAKLTDLNLGSILVILEADCFKGSGVKNLTVASYYPPVTAAGVFTEGLTIDVTVPADLVDAYKAAAGWSFLNIKGDANLVAAGKELTMPHGLYYAGDDNQLHCLYADGQEDTYIVDLPHMFQIAQFNNRIYGASPGVKFWYSASSGNEGDGKLFYISTIDGHTFQATVLDNAGNNAYKDPNGLYIYGSTLYVNDRNVAILKIDANDIALPQDYPSWMENNWMPFYNQEWSYGCIKCGFAITPDLNADGTFADATTGPLYWLPMKYNGCGLYTFHENNIGSSAGAGPREGANAYLTNVNLIATAWAFDQKHGDIYLYIDNSGSTEANMIKGGLYRFKIADMLKNPNPSADDFAAALNLQLIDGSPVKYEGNATNEHVGISQLSIDEDGEYLYWCYRAPSPEEAAANEAQDYKAQSAGKYWWADKYDAENPLHQSGIKRIHLGEATPVVEMVKAGVTGYGIAPFQYAGSKKPVGVSNPVTEVVDNCIAINTGVITVSENATVVIYNAAGLIVNMADLTAGQSLDTADLAAGLYIVEARTAAGSDTAKFVK